MTVASVLANDALQFMGLSSPMMSAGTEAETKVFEVIESLFDQLPMQNIYLQLQRPASASADLLEPRWSKLALVAVIAHYSANYCRVQFNAGQQLEIDRALGLLRNKAGKPIEARGSPYRNCEWIYWYPGQNEKQITLYDIKNKDESKVYEFDFTDEVTRQNTTLSSVTIENIGVNDATITNVVTSGNIRTSRLTFGKKGHYLVRARGTFSSSEIYDIFVQVNVADPESYYRSTSD